MPPKEPVPALSAQAWKKMPAGSSKSPWKIHTGTCRGQLWCYPPELFARDGRVDCFSLYLSLRTEEDARVEAALEEMMAKMAWS